MALIFAGCNNEDESSLSYNQEDSYFYLGEGTYDYYEIANGSILSTSIGANLTNVAYIINLTNKNVSGSFKEEIVDYNIVGMSPIN